MRKALPLIQFPFSRTKISQIPSLQSFLKPPSKTPRNAWLDGQKLTFHIETYGCQMNVSDSQIVRSVLSQTYQQVNDMQQAHVVLLNTCAIRQSAQERIYQRIKDISKKSVIAVLGCMAQRLKDKMFAAGVQVVCGPDAYRDLPRLIGLAVEDNTTQMNVMLSAEETYADIAPVRRNPNSVNAFLSIMRGCNNMCSFCIVPFVRGRERSMNFNAALQEIDKLERQGVKEVTFLGQNVNSYHDTTTNIDSPHNNSQGFSQLYKLRSHPGARFADLLSAAAERFPNIRFRFTSPHPKDFPDEVITAIGKYNNICKHVHLPAQSGNNQMLIKMRRNHTIQAYMELVKKMRKIPGLALSTDLIAGFCGQTQQQFEQTIDLLKQVKFEMAFLFAYSMRQRTHAHRKYQDDVPQEIKQKRLKRMIDTFIEIQSPLNQAEVGKTHLLLIEGKAKRDQNVLMGKTDHFKNGYVKITSVPVYQGGQIIKQRQFKLGDYLVVKVQSAGPRSLQCKPIAIASTLNEFYNYQGLFEALGNQTQAAQLL